MECLQKRIGRITSLYYLFGVKCRKEGNVEAVRVDGNVKEYDIRVA